ncbi:MAG: uroporphyrinogen-III synthase, partial [Burkholderiales bacterium]
PDQQFDSEALLKLPGLQNIEGLNIVIFRGDGGREVLGNELQGRGARVEYAECYRRSKPDNDAGVLLHHWARNEISAITVTSGEAMHNLFDLVGKLGQQWLKKTPLYVTHPRIAEIAAELGLKQVVVTPQGDQGLIEGLIRGFGSPPNELRQD